MCKLSVVKRAGKLISSSIVSCDISRKNFSLGHWLSITWWIRKKYASVTKRKCQIKNRGVEVNCFKNGIKFSPSSLRTQFSLFDCVWSGKWRNSQFSSFMFAGFITSLFTLSETEDKMIKVRRMVTHSKDNTREINTLLMRYWITTFQLKNSGRVKATSLNGVLYRKDNSESVKLRSLSLMLSLKNWSSHRSLLRFSNAYALCMSITNNQRKLTLSGKIHQHDTDITLTK